MTKDKAIFRLLQPVILLHVVIAAGIAGYMILEKLAFLEAVYLTTVNITTVGSYSITLSAEGKIFTIVLLIASWAMFAFVIARITQFVISGEVHQYFKNRRKMKAINQLTNHVIVCGYGRNGQQAANILASHGLSFVVVEKEEQLEMKPEADSNGRLLIKGDATDDDTLRLAGVEKARALITTLPADAQNVFIVLSARSLNPALNIISRASEASSVAKLKKAGANNVIMPDYIGGTHMATLVSRPDVVEFIDYLSGEQGNSIHIESVEAKSLPKNLVDKPLKEIMDWNKTGVNCIGIKDAEGRFFINPPGETLITPAMKIIVLGTREQIARMISNLS
ncbi:MAG: potassium channel protein [Chitinophagaceae bacterium]|nr:potassium channel protein [Chitinophagaceae bacterium]